MGDAELSMSVRLRQVQADLAASQTDLTRVERERDEALRRAADLEQVREELKQLRLLADGYLEDIQQLESGRDVHIDSLREQRDLARAEMSSARAQLPAQLRQLAAERRAEAGRYKGMSPPHYTGVNLLAEARTWDAAAVLVEQALGCSTPCTTAATQDGET